MSTRCVLRRGGRTDEGKVYMDNTVRYILAAVIGYLLGSVSVAVLYSRLKMGRDVRTQGSGNAGATNVARVFGMKAGLITLFGDMLKTALAGLIGKLLGGDTGLAVACAGCLIGHCAPIWFGFKGGKGVSVSACIGLMLDWRLFIVIFVVFFAVFFVSRRVSLCSISAAFVYPFAYYFFNRAFDAGFYVSCIVAVLVIFMHRANISRLIHGTEPKFKPKSKG